MISNNEEATKSADRFTILAETPCKVDKKAMIRNRYNRIPNPALNTKWERDTHN